MTAPTVNMADAPALPRKNGTPKASGEATSATPTAAAQGIASRGIRVFTRMDRGILLMTVIALLFALNLWLNFPGKMGNDAINQYAEATTGRYTDWHPPIMAWLWSKLRFMGNGPGPLLTFHLVLYWLGFGLLADAARRAGAWRAALLLAFAGFFPPFVYTTADVTKDVGMAVSWLAAVGLIFWFRMQDRKVPLLCGVLAALLIAYGALVRTNAVFGLGPLLLYAFAPASWLLRTRRLIVATTIAALLVIPLSQILNRQLFNPAPTNAVQSLFLFDLLGMAAHERNPALIEPRAKLSPTQLEACYTPYWWDSLSPWGRCAAAVNRPDANNVVLEGLAAQWAMTIVRHPIAYAVHRLKHFNSAVFFAVPLKHVRLTPEYQTGDPARPPFEIVTPGSIRFDLVKKSPFIWPVVWLTWCVVLLAFLRDKEPAPSTLLARVLLVSALGYSAAYLFIGVATDMRYHFWSLIAILISTLLTQPVLAQGFRTRSLSLLAGLAAVGSVMLIGLATRLLDFKAFVV